LFSGDCVNINNGRKKLAKIIKIYFTLWKGVDRGETRGN
jgi:hypothetical protein